MNIVLLELLRLKVDLETVITNPGRNVLFSLRSKCVCKYVSLSTLQLTSFAACPHPPYLVEISFPYLSSVSLRHHKCGGLSVIR